MRWTIDERDNCSDFRQSYKITSPTTARHVTPRMPQSLVEEVEGFGLDNLPWGVFSTEHGRHPRIGVALGDFVVDVSALSAEGFFTGPVLSKLKSCFTKTTLNDFMSMGPSAWAEARATLQRLLNRSEGTLRDNPQLLKSALLPKVSCAFVHGDGLPSSKARCESHRTVWRCCCRLT